MGGREGEENLVLVTLAGLLSVGQGLFQMVVVDLVLICRLLFLLLVVGYYMIVVLVNR